MMHFSQEEFLRDPSEAMRAAERMGSIFLTDKEGVPSVRITVPIEDRHLSNSFGEPMNPPSTIDLFVVVGQRRDGQYFVSQSQADGHTGGFADAASAREYAEKLAQKDAGLGYAYYVTRIQTKSFSTAITTITYP